MSDTSYNGWKNYPTWAVALWIDNEQGTYLYAREMADDALEMAPTDSNTLAGIWTAEQTARFRLADATRGWVEDHLAPDLGASMAADLFGWALDQVDWVEIATNWLSETELDNSDDDNEGETL